MTNYSNTPLPTTRSVPSTSIKFPESCGLFLYGTINGEIRICDITLLLPNTIFLVFLCYKLGDAHKRLASAPCPIVKTFYIMVVLVSAIGVARCFVSLLLTSLFLKSKGEALVLKVIWLILRCFLLAVELSIIIFGLCAGHLDSRRSRRRVICATSLCAVTFFALQTGLEIKHPGYHKGPYDKEYKLFSHGGMVFWFTSSTFFGLVYFIIMMVPCTGLTERYLLPKKRTFYIYCGFLVVVNFVQSVGCALLYFQEPFGLCIVDCTIFIYFALFAPLAYCTFLAGFFRRHSGYAILSTNCAGSSIPYQTFSDSLDNGSHHLPRRNILAPSSIASCHILA